MTGELRNKSAIVGIGQTEFSRNSGRSPLHLACEAVLEACADAGISPAEVNGIVRYSVNFEFWDIDLMRSLGLTNLRYFVEVPHGGGAACGTVAAAVAGIVSGQADCVIALRALNESSGMRFGQTSMLGSPGWAQYSVPHGFVTPAQWVAINAQRYLHEFGHDTTAFGAVTVLSRKHAATNPRAMMFERPITMEDHQNSPWISEPLRRFDCCLDTDGACAVVIVPAERAKQLKSQPVYIAAAAQGTGSRTEMMTSYQRASLSTLEEANAVAEDLYREADVQPADINVVEIYDHFTPMVLMQLESYGFAGRGKAPDLFRSGRLELTGDLPYNTHGGHLGEGYIHGFNHILEGVRQLRGTAVNQTSDPKLCLVTAGTGVPTSGLILAKEAY